jgi:hypothetical protein
MQLVFITMFCGNQLDVLRGIQGSLTRNGWYRYKEVRAGNRNSNLSVGDGGHEEGQKNVYGE